MKKLTTIIAFALVITIGGVFAAWHYATAAVDSLTLRPGLQMTTVETHSDVAQGVIEQVSAHTFTFRVDDTYDNKEQNGQTPEESDRYLAMLTASGSWTFKFTPNEDAPIDVQNGVPLSVTVTVEGSAQYDGKVLLTTAENNVISIAETTEDITIYADQILACLDFVDNVVLDTPEKNAEFADALASYLIKIEVSRAA